MEGKEEGQSAVQELEKEACCCCHERTKLRDGEEFRDLIHRLNRIEGQVRGVRNMVEGHRYCVDILTQVSAIQSALNGFTKELLASHIKTCVVQDIQQGKEATIDELVKTLQKLMR